MIETSSVGLTLDVSAPHVVHGALVGFLELLLEVALLYGGPKELIGTSFKESIGTPGLTIFKFK